MIRDRECGCDNWGQAYDESSDSCYLCDADTECKEQTLIYKIKHGNINITDVIIKENNMECKSCIKLDVCKYKISYEQYLDKIKGIDFDDMLSGHPFETKVTCKSFSQSIPMPRRIGE